MLVVFCLFSSVYEKTRTKPENILDKRTNQVHAAISFRGCRDVSGVITEAGSRCR